MYINKVNLMNWLQLDWKGSLGDRKINHTEEKVVSLISEPEPYRPPLFVQQAFSKDVG
jgi:hypothetical protein